MHARARRGHRGRADRAGRALTGGPESQSELLVGLVDRFAGAAVWVVGDVMLDDYLTGDVARISPEAPVPVVQVRDQFTRLGGAANVARSIAALGGQVSLCGVIGDDEAGRQLVAGCEGAAIDHRALGVDAARPTTRKLRVLGHGQQLLRLDWEHTGWVDAALADRLVDALLAGPPPAAITISDYAKGFVTPELVARVVAAGVALGVPVLVDPKRGDPAIYQGATVLKPNLKELELLAGRSLAGLETAALAEVARGVLEGAAIGAMVLTLGSRGLLVVQRDGQHALVAASKREVFDVTGAGDTVLAALALALAAGGDLAQAAVVANTAAGIVVGEVGTATVAPTRLVDALRPRSATKRVSSTAIGARVRSWQRAGKRVVFTNGCFDLLHAGHLAILQSCAAQGDVLIVGVNSDASVRRLKGPTRPLVPEHERAALLGALDCVDAVVVFEDDTPLALLEQVRPDVLVKGQDYTLDQVVGRELVEAAGGRVVLVPLLPQHSTTGLLERIRNQG